jgi:sugar/nucleoside kinase (ribokinase family)
VGRVGDDDAGEFSRSDLANESIDVVLDVVPEAFSHFSLIIVDRATGKRTIIWDRDPKLRYGEGELEIGDLLETQFLLLDGNDPAASVVAAREARTAAVQTVLDIDRVTQESEELLSLVRIAIPSMSFVREFAGVLDWREGLETIRKICPGLLGVTLGEDGAAVVWEGKIFEFPSFPVDVVDSTAAGDVFHGAFVFAILQGWSLGRCMRFSNAAGALACRQFGARASIPSLEDVLDTEKGD